MSPVWKSRKRIGRTAGRHNRTKRLKPPKVYAAITAVSAELAKKGIAKSQTNADEQYRFRGIDDVYNQLSPALAAHKLCILPRVLERSCIERNGSNGGLLMSVSLKVAFDFVSAQDGSSHTIKSFGEALDGGDKATAKAMTAAYKYAIFQAFCIPVVGSEDADATTHQLRNGEHVPEPVQGWEQWTRDLTDVAGACETAEALDRLQGMNRALLKAVSRERPDLYSSLGEVIRRRRESQLTLSSKVKPSRRNSAAVATKPTTQKLNGGSSHA